MPTVRSSPTNRAFEDLDLDAVADLRLALDEACTQLIGAATPGTKLIIDIVPSIDAVVVTAAVTCRPDTLPPSRSGFSWHVLTSLVHDVDTFAHSAEGGIGLGTWGYVLSMKRLSLSP